MFSQTGSPTTAIFPPNANSSDTHEKKKRLVICDTFCMRIQNVHERLVDHFRSWAWFTLKDFGRGLLRFSQMFWYPNSRLLELPLVGCSLSIYMYIYIYTYSTSMYIYTICIYAYTVIDTYICQRTSVVQLPNIKIYCIYISRILHIFILKLKYQLPILCIRMGSWLKYQFHDYSWDNLLKDCGFTGRRPTREGTFCWRFRSEMPNIRPGPSLRSYFCGYKL